MSLVSYRQADDIERLTISVVGTNRGLMFSDIGDEIGRILPTCGDLLATEEFVLKAETLPDLLAEFLHVVQEGIKEGIAHTLWQCTHAHAYGDGEKGFKLYVLTHTEELDSLVEIDLVATKWFESDTVESAEIILRVPSVLG